MLNLGGVGDQRGVVDRVGVAGLETGGNAGGGGLHDERPPRGPAQVVVGAIVGVSAELVHLAVDELPARDLHGRPFAGRDEVGDEHAVSGRRGDRRVGFRVVDLEAAADLSPSASANLSLSIGVRVLTPHTSL